DPTIARLIDRNSQWARAIGSSEPRFFHEMAKGQAPKVLWIGCSDSRVPESVVTASKPGEIFVHRNIANQFHLDDDSALSVLTYAIENLGVEHVVVVGHTQCGGAAACYEAAKEAKLKYRHPFQGADTAYSNPGANTSANAKTPLGRWLAPLTDIAASLDLDLMHTDPDRALTQLVQANVQKQVENLCIAPPVRAVWDARGGPGFREHKLWVHGLLYEVESGALRDLGVTRG
ncbi:carbonic anhydrase, partial [Vararia minispora EC-137]